MLTFLGLGAQKAGTTWLHAHLARHPGLRMPQEKEIFFWDRANGADIEGYRAKFNHPSLQEGDITPSYAIARSEAIARCRTHFPDMKFIFIARKPQDRAWSLVKMNFAQRGKRFTEADLDEAREIIHRPRQIRLGLYGECLARWTEHFPRDRFLVLHYDDLAARPRRFLQRVAEHLAIDKEAFGETGALRRRVHQGDPAPAPPAIAAELDTLFAASWAAFEPAVERL